MSVDLSISNAEEYFISVGLATVNCCCKHIIELDWWWRLPVWTANL